MEKFNTKAGKQAFLYRNWRFYIHQKQGYYYSTKLHAGQTDKCLHRQVWLDNFGLIPEGFHVHHKNQDKENNSPENLELVAASEHSALHHYDKGSRFYKKWQEAGQTKAKAWHRSPEGLQWHKEHAEKCRFGKNIFGEAKCKQCGEAYTKKSFRSFFCSNNCKSAWRRKNCPDKTNVSCKTCGVLFETLKYLPNKFCSKKCRPAPNPKGRGK